MGDEEPSSMSALVNASSARLLSEQKKRSRAPSDLSLSLPVGGLADSSVRLAQKEVSSGSCNTLGCATDSNSYSHIDSYTRSDFEADGRGTDDEDGEPSIEVIQDMCLHAEGSSDDFDVGVPLDEDDTNFKSVAKDSNYVDAEADALQSIVSLAMPTSDRYDEVKTMSTPTVALVTPVKPSLKAASAVPVMGTRGGGGLVSPAEQRKACVSFSPKIISCGEDTDEERDTDSGGDGSNSARFVSPLGMSPIPAHASLTTPIHATSSAKSKSKSTTLPTSSDASFASSECADPMSSPAPPVTLMRVTSFAGFASAPIYDAGTSERRLARMQRERRRNIMTSAEFDGLRLQFARDAVKKLIHTEMNKRKVATALPKQP